MTHLDEGFLPLPAYGVRASIFDKFVLGNVDESNRSAVVLSGMGPQSVPIHFRADGIVIFEFDKSNRYAGGAVQASVVGGGGQDAKDAARQSTERDALKEKRFKYMNAFLTCLHVSSEVSSKLAPPSSQSSYIWARFEDGVWTLRDNGVGLIQPLPRGETIAAERLERGLAAFRRIEGDQCQQSLDTLDLFFKAAFNLSHHEFQTVLILGWAIVEGCQDIVWKRLIEGGYKRFNPHSEITGKRKALLLTDRNFTASVKSQVLALTGEYADWELRQIDIVRKRRNGFMHSLEPINVVDAFGAMSACRIVAKKSLDLDLETFGNPGGWDYKR